MKLGSFAANRGNNLVLGTALAISALVFSSNASAQHMHGGHAHAVWHGDIARFHEHDWGVWRGGHWTHSWHGGRYGWWWLAGGLWYYYPNPIYPYPGPWEPPVATVVTPGAAVTPPPTNYWYFCQASNSYYPYVSACPGGWQRVPATPAPPAAPQ
ncbi:MAG TPA: hypothetical protein VIF60_22755 [Burkholderiaceae bacterium]|jgi:hypothetical protein